jgi:hypothetical protein
MSAQQISSHEMQPGDILEYRCPIFGIAFQWRVHGIFLGADHQESLIEVSPVMARPGEHSFNGTVFVPEPMTRNLHVLRKAEVTA